MTTELEDRLMAAMRQEVAGLALTTDVVGAARRRHGRGTAVRRTLYAAGVAGGALVAVMVAGTGGQPGLRVSAPPVARALAPTLSPAVSSTLSSTLSPALRLVAAIADSENVSYQVKATWTGQDATWASVTEGAFDPATATGYLRSAYPDKSGFFYEERLIDGVRYVGSSGSATFKQDPGTYDRLAYDNAMNGALGATADPERLFATLRDADAAVTQTSEGVYHFDVTVDDQTLSGEVTLDAGKRIAKVVYERTTQGQKDGQAFTIRDRVTLELSGYGMPVTVERPADVVVVS